MTWEPPTVKAIGNGLIVLLVSVVIGCSRNPTRNGELVLQDLTFGTVATAEPDTIRTLSSLKREGDLFLITYYGDYRARLEGLNDQIIEYGISSIIPTGGFRSACSIFAGLGNPEQPIFGRNLDNNARRAVLVGLFTPPDGYASIGVSNMYHMGFGPEDDPTLLPLSERRLLLNCVLFTDDGINECGVAVALASVDAAHITRDENRKLVCISYLLREILDHAATLDEAVAIVENRDVFDQDVHTLSHHILIADAAGRSAIAEYADGGWRIMENEKPWQIVTNTRLYGMTEEWVRSRCRRYRVADDYLTAAGGDVTWREGVEILDMMSVPDTQWSSVYDLMDGTVYLSLHRKLNQVQSVRFRWSMGN